MTQLPNEPADAFAAFNDYCRMGEKRTIRGLNQSGISKESVSTLLKWSRRWNWQERVKEFDANTQDAINKRWQAERVAEKRARIDTAKALRGAGIKVLTNIDLSKESLATATGAIRTALDQLRAEFDDEPVSRHEISGAVSRPSIPPELISDDARREGALLVIDEVLRGEGDEE